MLIHLCTNRERLCRIDVGVCMKVKEFVSLTFSVSPTCLREMQSLRPSCPLTLLLPPLSAHGYCLHKQQLIVTQSSLRKKVMYNFFSYTTSYPAHSLLPLSLSLSQLSSSILSFSSFPSLPIHALLSFSLNWESTSTHDTFARSYERTTDCLWKSVWAFRSIDGSCARRSPLLHSGIS